MVYPIKNYGTWFYQLEVVILLDLQILDKKTSNDFEWLVNIGLGFVQFLMRLL